MSRLRLHPNVGAEEPGGPGVEAARAVARLWRRLFPADAGWPEPDPPPSRVAALDADGAAFSWLPEAGLCAWWNDAGSARAAADCDLPLVGPDPAAVARVHDKGFCARLCREERIGPRWLSACIRVFAPEDLAEPAAFRETLRRALANWPEALRESATLKPRFGTSGRGRVPVRDPGNPALAGALPRLAARGGAVLEPWLARISDHSVQLHIGADGTLTLLGTLQLRVSRSGVYRGHGGEIDHRGRIVGGGESDDALLAAATEVARAAHGQGYAGPCAVDAFRFRWQGEEALRPVVELNARFTTGTVAIGLLRRARAWLDAALPPEPGARRCFGFGLGDGGGAPDDAAARIDLPEERAQLWFARGPLPGAGS